jgi:hypothetical protein
MDCRVKPGKDGGELVPAILGPFDRRALALFAWAIVTITRAGSNVPTNAIRAVPLSFGEAT